MENQEDGVLVGDGLTILSTGTIEEARGESADPSIVTKPKRGQEMTMASKKYKHDKRRKIGNLG